MHCCGKRSQKDFPEGFSFSRHLLWPSNSWIKDLDLGWLSCGDGLAGWSAGLQEQEEEEEEEETLPETLAGKHQEACTKWQTPNGRSKWQEKMVSPNHQKQDDNVCECARLLLQTLKPKMGSQNFPLSMREPKPFLSIVINITRHPCTRPISG